MNQIKIEWKVAGAFSSFENTSAILMCKRLHEDMLVPVLMYDNESLGEGEGEI